MTNRTLLLLVVLGSIALAVLWNHSILTPDELRYESGFLGQLSTPSGPVAYANPPAPRDTMSESAILRRIERLYRMRADLLEAQAAREPQRVEKILDAALQEIRPLLRRPGLVDRPRFRAVVQEFSAEYENRYGVPDTLALPGGSVYELRSSLFTTINERGAPALGEVFPADLRAKEGPVPMTINGHVRESMQFLLKHKDRHLYPWLRRASTYFPMIEQIFAEEGVPDVLKYLALAESGLDPQARSRAKAAGIWQFVAKTGRRYGLSVDPWVDERLDPEKSTRAAARHLKDLYELFGDWQLALAGYNCNPRLVQHAVSEFRQRTGRKPSFWDIYEDLPPETRNYVPLFTATALIISNPAEFDLERVRKSPRYAFDYVPVEVPLKLRRVARLADVKVEKVKALNPELRSDRLPPSEAPYYVRLPYGTYETFADNYANLPEEERAQSLQHVVQAGESAGRVAERYHVDRSALLEANGETSPMVMRLGQRLKIPETTYAGNAEVAADTDAQPIRVRYGSRAVRPLLEEAPDPDLTASGGSAVPAGR